MSVPAGLSQSTGAALVRVWARGMPNNRGGCGGGARTADIPGRKNTKSPIMSEQDKGAPR
jgi:hypothetical protein